MRHSSDRSSTSRGSCFECREEAISADDAGVRLACSDSQVQEWLFHMGDGAWCEGSYSALPQLLVGSGAADLA